MIVAARARFVVAGFGFRSGATPESLRSAFAAAGGGADALAAPADKAARLVEAMGREVIPVTAEVLEAQETLTVSAASLAARRAGSVAEACALAAAGPGARLLGPRAVSPDRMATCALARVPSSSGSAGGPPTHGDPPAEPEDDGHGGEVP